MKEEAWGVGVILMKKVGKRKAREKRGRRLGRY